ncbi:hypothetical protein KW787_01425 [Candidatus Pacearchaeota archaeon]|nr:hypothetical protein [Candidatus Pacearchaeota archaeon]
MEAILDNYLQLRLSLTEKEVQLLEKGIKIIDQVWRPSNPIPYNLIFVGPTKEDHARQEELFHPEIMDLDFQNTFPDIYEIYLSKRRIEMIKGRKVVDGDHPRRWLRMSIVSLVGVY